MPKPLVATMLRGFKARAAVKEHVWGFLWIKATMILMSLSASSARAIGRKELAPVDVINAMKMEAMQFAGYCNTKRVLPAEPRSQPSNVGTSAKALEDFVGAQDP